MILSETHICLDPDEPEFVWLSCLSGYCLSCGEPIVAGESEVCVGVGGVAVHARCFGVEDR